MMWDWHDYGWWWFVMSIGMIVFWGAVIWLVATFLRKDSAGGSDAGEILAERLARGEIDVDEYRERRDALQDGTGRAA
jgi:putative membrane protein